MLLLVSLLGCQSPTEGATGTLRGEVVAGPGLPGGHRSARSRLRGSTRPGRGTLLEAAEGDGGQVRIIADEDGLFELALSPGRYMLIPQPVEGLLGTAAPVTLEIAAGTTTELSVVYDTGIR